MEGAKRVKDGQGKETEEGGKNSEAPIAKKEEKDKNKEKKDKIKRMFLQKAKTIFLFHG